MDEIVTPAVLEYQINRLDVPSDDRQRLQLDRSFIPAPSVNQKDSTVFHLPPEQDIV